jgi:hypothetical protein
MLVKNNKAFVVAKTNVFHVRTSLS